MKGRWSGVSATIEAESGLRHHLNRIADWLLGSPRSHRQPGSDHESVLLPPLPPNTTRPVTPNPSTLIFCAFWRSGRARQHPGTLGNNSSGHTWADARRDIAKSPI